jgi:hypothetical protein
MFPDNIQFVRSFIAIVIPFFITKESTDMYLYFRSSWLLTQGKGCIAEKQEKKQPLFKTNKSFQGY